MVGLRRSGIDLFRADPETVLRGPGVAGPRGRVPVGMSPGSAFPLGVSLGRTDGDLNFAVSSRHAERMSLCLVHADIDSGDTPVLEVELDGELNRTGDVWHVSLSNLLPEAGKADAEKADLMGRMSWGWRARGKISESGSWFDDTRVLADPYIAIARPGDLET